MRIGHGYDVHKLIKNRKLILGGFEIDSEIGLLGHSDADVVVHAIMDSLLGAMALGDIGIHFPDTDDEYKNANSLKLLSYVCQLTKEKNYKISNIDVTVVIQKPRIENFIPKMRENISKICKIDLNQINIKATTEEGLGFTGTSQGISAYAVSLIKEVRNAF